MNIKLLSILAVIAIVSISGCTQSTGNQNGGGNQAGNSVEIKNFAFVPSEITIKSGETIVWTNKDSTSHTITSDSGSEISSPSLSNGQTYSHTFNSAGAFDYHCSIHPSMKGKVIVE